MTYQYFSLGNDGLQFWFVCFFGEGLVSFSVFPNATVSFSFLLRFRLPFFPVHGRLCLPRRWLVKVDKAFPSFVVLGQSRHAMNY